MSDVLVPILVANNYLILDSKRFHNFSPNAIYAFSLIHNFGLHIFSLYTFSQLFRALINNGISLESGFYFNQPSMRWILFLFYLSKYYEYVDTMILYAKHKQPIFLQKFHHIGATIVWHLGFVYEFEGVYFASLINSGIHTVMYGYYFLSLFQDIRPMINKYKIYITSAQVGQLAFGFVALPWFYYSKESLVNQRIIVVFDLYIGCLIVLFLQFMIKNYSKKTI
uniref:Very-long-chain 3-oxoacyl-CoA synthase n=1 Tax=viral metagenome TaxID=1070528 RepID=A0A6C0L7J9_9ZZZZ